MAAKCILFSSIACFTSEKLVYLKSVWILAPSQTRGIGDLESKGYQFAFFVSILAKLGRKRNLS